MQEEVGKLTLEPAGFAFRRDDPAIGEIGLLVETVRRVIPTGGLNLRTNQLAAGIRFVFGRASSGGRKSW